MHGAILNKHCDRTRNAEYHSGYAYLLTSLPQRSGCRMCDSRCLAPKRRKRNMVMARPEKYGKPEEAVAEYRQTLQLDPNHADAHIDLGNLLFENGESAEAKDHFQKASTLN